MQLNYNQDEIDNEICGAFVKCDYFTWRSSNVAKTEVLKRNKKGDVIKWSYWRFVFNPIIWLRKCDICHKRSTPRKINYYYTRAIGSDKYGTAYDLCLSCRNKVKAIEKRYEEVSKTKTIINQLKKGITNARKNQNNGAVESFSI